MHILTATEARELSSKNKHRELEQVIELIRNKSMEGKTILHLYFHIQEQTINVLKASGYTVFLEGTIIVIGEINRPKISIQW